MATTVVNESIYDRQCDQNCSTNGKWCGAFNCDNRPEFTEGRSCKMCQGSKHCLEQQTWCGEVHCINYEKLMENPHPTVNNFIGEACSPWQENDGRGGRFIEGLNRNDYTEAEQQKIIDEYNAQADAEGRDLSQEVLREAILKFMA